MTADQLQDLEELWLDYYQFCNMEENDLLVVVYLSIAALLADKAKAGSV